MRAPTAIRGPRVVGGAPSAFAAQYYEHVALLRESVQKLVGDDTQQSVEFDLLALGADGAAVPLATYRGAKRR